MSFKKVFVDVSRNGRIIASYDFGCGETQGPSLPPNRQHLIAKAKQI
jgi:hypothetical protein